MWMASFALSRTTAPISAGRSTKGTWRARCSPAPGISRSSIFAQARCCAGRRGRICRCMRCASRAMMCCWRAPADQSDARALHGVPVHDDNVTIEKVGHVEGPSHVVFGLAGAVALESALHIAGPPLLELGHAPSAEQIAIKGIFYGLAALGALVPDIDNARSTLGKRLGVVSRQIQKHA